MRYRVMNSTYHEFIIVLFSHIYTYTIIPPSPPIPLLILLYPYIQVPVQRPRQPVLHLLALHSGGRPGTQLGSYILYSLCTTIYYTIVYVTCVCVCSPATTYCYALYS